MHAIRFKEDFECNLLKKLNEGDFQELKQYLDRAEPQLSLYEGNDGRVMVLKQVLRRQPSSLARQVSLLQVMFHGGGTIVQSIYRLGQYS